MLKLTIIATLAACATQPKEHPTVAIIFDQPGVPDDVTALVLAGADAWAGLDIPGGAQTLGTRQDNTPCIPTWFDGSQLLPCTVTIHVTFVEKSELGGAAALTDKARHTMLAYELTGDFLQSVVAHEVGHSIFDTSDHLVPGDVGIMAAAPTSDTPTEADIAFAVEHTQGWVTP